MNYQLDLPRNYENTQIVKISNIKANYNAYPKEVKRIIKKYYKEI